MSDREKKATRAPKAQDGVAGPSEARTPLQARPGRTGFDIEAAIQRAIAQYPAVRAYLARND